MPTFVKASHDVETKTTEFIADDGSRCYRSGGAPAWRCNNPGNLRPPERRPPRFTKGYIGIGITGNGPFFIFPDYETGRRELKAHILRKHTGRTIPEMMYIYAQPEQAAHEKIKNDTAAYVKYLIETKGLPKDKKVEDLSEQEMTTLMDGIQAHEGYFKDKETQKELWKNSTGITVTNGSRPIAGAELMIRKNGKDTPVTTNASGKIPPIIHNPKEGVVEVFFKNIKHEWESFLKVLPESASKAYHLVFDHVEVQAPTAAHVPPTKPKKTTIEPMKYVVQPGDTFSKIATKFKVSVDDLKKGNPQVKDVNKIYPGEAIYVFGSAPAVKPTVGAAVPVKTEHKPEPTHKAAAPNTAPPNTTKPAHKPAQAASTTTSTTVPHEEPGIVSSVGNKISAILGRSNEGKGPPVAAIPPNVDKDTPWMAIATAEAKLWGKYDEEDIGKTKNYHSLVNPRNGIKALENLSGGSAAWCGSFVAWCMMQVKLPHLRNYFRATAWTDENVKMFPHITEPVYGCVAVWNRSGGGGHVTLVYGKEKGTNNIIVLGGNQGQQITFTARSATKKLRGFVVPACYEKRANELITDKVGLPEYNVAELNKKFEITILHPDKKKTES